ncbi:hypothetical protein SAMN04488005_2781 [Yoonia tamlensis]|uniref:Uncharacterized protein n=1 Tax=Yoonia tamlensis TaxID=390270 RepID=A0A1I6HJY6_9RHOB|nr:hypothetical protein [Yoonia tamlensis]SFR54684.1 hypothetical protein SAMN04488005_2781 [Yoonia tamlensis]
MLRTITVKTVLTTVALALGIGFFVQLGETLPSMTRAPVTTTVPRAVTVVTNTRTSAIFGVPAINHQLVDHLSQVQTVAYVHTNSEVDAPEMGIISAAPVIDDPCKVVVSASGIPAAMAVLAIDAPCHQNADFVVVHETLRFSGRTDATGHAEVRTPILAKDARFSVRFGNVEHGRTAIYMPDVAHYDRTILQWRGADYLQLHVLEAGARIGQTGHIWTGSSHTGEITVLGQRGFVASYGSARTGIPLQAEVYSFPARFGRPDMSVDMPIGLMVTPENCGRAVDVQLIQVVLGQIWSPTDIAISVPSCDSVGEFVMLPDAIAPYTRLMR